MNDDGADQLRGILQEYDAAKNTLHVSETINLEKEFLVAFKKNNEVHIRGVNKENDSWEVKVSIVDEQSKNFLKGVVKSLIGQQINNLNKKLEEL